jgi:hypothetical protein
MPTTRIDPALEALGVLVPVTLLVALFGYSRQRARDAWNDERGLSETVQIAIWAGVALVAALTVGGVIVVAIRNRSSDVGNDIENSPLP